MLKEKYKDQLHIYQCDLKSDEEVKKAVDSIYASWGRIDVLVNNACIAIFKSFEEKSIDETKEEFEVNYFGAIRMIQAVLPYMQNQGQGIIHNVSSGVGSSGFPGIHGYASTKGAIEALTRSLALELKEYNIFVNVMHPPLTNTKSARPLGIPAQMMANPEEVGSKLAKKIMSTKNIVTPDFKTSMSIFFTLKFPFVIGNLLSKLTEKQKNQMTVSKDS